MSPPHILPPLEKGRRYWLDMTGHERDACFEQLAASKQGPHGWLAGDGGLIANLRVWENCLLPLSYFGAPPTQREEARFIHLLNLLDIPEAEQAGFAGSPTGSLNGRQKRLACALRTLMAQPSLILAEGEWLGRLDQADTQRLVSAFAAECPDATWLILGGSQPDAAWHCNEVNTGSSHAPAA